MKLLINKLYFKNINIFAISKTIRNGSFMRYLKYDLVKQIHLQNCTNRKTVCSKVASHTTPTPLRNWTKGGASKLTTSLCVRAAANDVQGR